MATQRQLTEIIGDLIKAIGRNETVVPWLDELAVAAKELNPVPPPLCVDCGTNMINVWVCPNCGAR